MTLKPAARRAALSPENRQLTEPPLRNKMPPHCSLCGGESTDDGRQKVMEMRRIEGRKGSAEVGKL